MVVLAGDTQLLSAVRAGDEHAFQQLVECYHGSLTRLARSFGASEAVAEEIVQETWLGALQGLDRFEERSSFKTWLFTILKNQARQRAVREKRSVPFSCLGGDGDVDDADGPLLDPSRFQSGDGKYPGNWTSVPRPWEEPALRLAAIEARDKLREAMAALPARQQVVVALRDVEGLDSDEVCQLLEISEANQRVLLHRGRTALRSALEEYLDG